MWLSFSLTFFSLGGKTVFSFCFKNIRSRTHGLWGRINWDVITNFDVSQLESTQDYGFDIDFK